MGHDQLQLRMAESYTKLLDCWLEGGSDAVLQIFQWTKEKVASGSLEDHSLYCHTIGIAIATEHIGLFLKEAGEYNFVEGHEGLSEVCKGINKALEGLPPYLQETAHDLMKVIPNGEE